MEESLKEAIETQTSCPHLLRASTPLGTGSSQGVDGRDKPGHDRKEEKIEANPCVLQELAKPDGEREHEIISRRRRDVVKPHGYPLSGRDGAGRSVLCHSDEKEKSGAGGA